MTSSVFVAVASTRSVAATTTTSNDFVVSDKDGCKGIEQLKLCELDIGTRSLFEILECQQDLLDLGEHRCDGTEGEYVVGYTYTVRVLVIQGSR